MDNAQKAIMIGVGLFITIIIIAAVMLITGMGQDLLNSGSQQVSNISDSLKAQLTSQYDGTTMTGSQVISAVKNLSTQNNMVVCVVNRNNYRKHYGKLTAVLKTSYINETKAISTSPNANPEQIGKITSSDQKQNYVSPTDSYNADLIKLDTGDVVGVTFYHK